jgi:Arylsulfotransferase (ASST)
VATTHDALIATRLDGTEYELFPVNLNSPVLRDTHHKFYVENADSTQATVMFSRTGDGIECDLSTPTSSAVGDGIAEIDLAGNEIWRFDYFDHTAQMPPENMDPDFCELYFWGPNTYDLTHGNSVSRYPGENAYLISYLSQDRVIKVNRTTGAIEWQMGHDLDFTWLGSEPADEKWFLLQHEPVWLPDDRILIYDNNKWQSWSRALELEVDLNNMTVEKAWEYRVPHGFGGGNAQRHANGNTLISSGNSHYTVEVESGGGIGDELFILEYDNTFARAQYYRPLWNY